MTRRLDDKVALVTGAARGIGECIARRFSQQGARVIVNDLDQEAADRVAEEIGGLGISADVSDSGAVAAMFREAMDFSAGRLDILVNNAGISGMENSREPPRWPENREDASSPLSMVPPNNTAHVTDAQWQRMIDVHLGGTFFCCREAIKIMLAQKSGSIINMASIMGTFGRPGAVAYSTAKAGILGLTRALAHEVAPCRVRVNSISPGWIDTAFTAPLAPVKPLITTGIPLGEFGDTDDIAWAAVYLASHEAKYVTGQSLSPNGGWYMSQ